jgi:Flp pilus assembly protein TadD/peroxiredoxin
VSRRDFLAASLQWASAALIPARAWGLAARSELPLEAQIVSITHDNRVVPCYRQKPPLEDVLAKVEPGLDVFLNEKYAEQIETTLGEWTAALRQSPPDLKPIVSSLTSSLRAASLRPSERRPLRPMPGLEVFRNAFSDDETLEREAFLNELEAFFSGFSAILTAEFKLTAISADGVSDSQPRVVRTRIRYDIVGEGRGFHRGERVGEWDLEWESAAAGVWRARKWQALGETESRAANPVFVDVTERWFRDVLSYREQLLPGVDYWRTVLDAASRIDVYGNNGVAVGDFDHDGFDDLYVCQPAGLPNRLYRNRGNGSFEDVTDGAGVGVLDNCPCALFADVNNSGRQDLIVVRVDGPLLFINQGDGRFHLKTDAFQFASPPQGTFTGAALADYDRDGRLDIYFCLYSYYLGLDQYHFPTPYYDAENGPPNFLMHNEGDGTFKDVTAAARMDQKNNRYSFACGWADYDGDGWPDCYVANDFGKKNLYRNNGDGTFTDVAHEAGVEDFGAGMSVCWCDYRNDGRPGIYVADMWTAAGKRVSAQDEFMKGAPAEVRALLKKHAMGNSLFRNEDGRRFDDAGAAAGVQMGRWAWSSDAWDFDQDGYADLYVANGMISGPNPRDLSSFFWRQVVAQTPADPVPSAKYQQGWNAINELIRADGTWAGYERNNFFANNRDGTFSDIGGTLGLDFIEDSRAFALADFDRDGRLELLLKNRSGPQIRLLKNVLPQPGNAIAFRVRGTKSNRDAVGAEVMVEAGGVRVSKFVQAGSGFLSQHAKELFVGVGQASGPVRATVRWPSGLVQRFEGLPVGHRISIEEGSHVYGADPFAAVTGPATVAVHISKTATEVSPPSPQNVQTWLLAPIAAPTFNLPDAAGKMHRLDDLRGGPALLYFWTLDSGAAAGQLRSFYPWPASRSPAGFNLLAINADGSEQSDRVRDFVRANRLAFPVLIASDETIAVYNILYRYLFDRRRDLGLPAAFLLDDRGMIVKLYQGALAVDILVTDAGRIPKTAADRERVALPFAGTWFGGEFERNQFTYALTLLQRGYPDPALAFARRALESDAQSAETYYLLGMTYLQKQASAEARQNFDLALKYRPSYPDTWPNAWNNLGMLAAEAGDNAEAIRNLQQALRLSPNNVTALDNLGSIYRREGRWVDAQQALEAALKADPEDADANYGLGMVFAQQNDTESAYKFLRRSLELRPNYPDAMNNLGVLLVRTDRRAEAAQVFAGCIASSPDYDQCYLNLVKLLVAERDTEKAKTILRQLLSRHPDHELAKRMLAELGN